MFLHLKTLLSHAAYGKSQDGSSLLRSALANERDKTNWGKRSLILPLLFCCRHSLYIKLPVFLSAGLAAHSRSFTLSVTFLQFPFLQDSLYFHTIFQSWHHQQLQFIYFPLILSSSRLFDECENITTNGSWGLISPLKSLLRSY